MRIISLNFSCILYLWYSYVNALRIVQYNAEWLFVNHYSAFDCPGTQCTWKNSSEAQTHLAYVARVVDYLSPDIINFCEVEGVAELNMVADLVSSTYSSYFVPGTDTATGQNVGMLSRITPNISLYRTEEKYAYPLPNSLCGYTGSSSTTGVSKHYITEFVLWDMRVAFIAAHLIAIPTDPARCAQREAQATVLRNVISSYLDKNYGVIVVGDMNDYDGNVLDVNGNKPISRVLDILKGNSTSDLISASSRILPIERYSDWWDSDSNCETESTLDYSMIDHVLISQNIQKYISNVFVYHGYPEFCGKYDSDHFPLVVDFYDE